MKIAGKDVKTTLPENLNDRLIAATGCGINEIETVLAAGPDRAARALRPFLEDRTLPGPELARAIAAEPALIDGIRELYANGEVSQPVSEDDAPQALTEDDAPQARAEGEAE